MPAPATQNALQPDAVTDMSVTKVTFITPVYDVTETGTEMPLNVPSRVVDVQDALVHEYRETLSMNFSVINESKAKVTDVALLGAMIQ